MQSLALYMISFIHRFGRLAVEIQEGEGEGDNDREIIEVFQVESI